jgi:hypothetical protein
MYTAMHKIYRALLSAVLVLGLSAGHVLAADTTQQPDTDKAEKIYKKVGPGGEVIYSDKPLPDSEEVTVPRGSEYKPVPPPAGFTPYQAPQKKPAQAPIVNTVTITAPKNDEAFFSGNGELTVSVSLATGLRPGQQLEYLIDGKQVYSGTETSHTLTNVYRGTHVLTVRLTDSSGDSLTSNAVTFHMQRPRVKTP